MSMIRVEKLSKAFGSLQVLKDVDLTVEKGERIVIIGGSGCGKSVFLRCMDFLEIPDEGAVFIGDDELTANQKDLNRIRRKVGMVFQGFHLFSHMNVLDNITLAPIKLLGLSREEAEKKAEALLKMVGLESKKYTMPDVLSGGQKQRIAIAGAVAMEPECIVFDEPTAMLDPRGRREVMNVIHRLNEKGITALLITHFMEEAAQADKVIVLDQGEVKMIGTPLEIFRRAEELKALSLGVPPAVDLADRLRQRGIEVPQDLLEVEDIVRYLCQLK